MVVDGDEILGTEMGAISPVCEFWTLIVTHCNTNEYCENDAKTAVDPDESIVDPNHTVVSNNTLKLLETLV